MDDIVSIEESILLSVKKSLGLPPEVDQFDPDLIMLINSVLNFLTQLGVGPVKGFEITSRDDVWDDFLDGDKHLNMIKSYVFMKVKLVFDPPTIGSVLSAYQETVKEYEGRISYQTDPCDAFNDQEE